MSTPTAPRRNPIFVLLAFMIAAYGAGFIGQLAINSALSFWYITIAKPAWAPPGWLFTPLLTILFGLMGWAAWIVWSVPTSQQPSGRRTAALVLFFSQLVLGAFWAWMFFGWHVLLVACLIVGVLWLAVLGNTILFWRIRPKAGMLMAAYLLWVTFASALTLATFRLNPPSPSAAHGPVEQSR